MFLQSPTPLSTQTRPQSSDQPPTGSTAAYAAGRVRSSCSCASLSHVGRSLYKLVSVLFFSLGGFRRPRHDGRMANQRPRFRRRISEVISAGSDSPIRISAIAFLFAVIWCDGTFSDRPINFAPRQGVPGSQATGRNAGIVLLWSAIRSAARQSCRERPCRTEEQCS